MLSYASKSIWIILAWHEYIISHIKSLPTWLLIRAVCWLIILRNLRINTYMDSDLRGGTDASIFCDTREKLLFFHSLQALNIVQKMVFIVSLRTEDWETSISALWNCYFARNVNPYHPWCSRVAFVPDVDVQGDDSSNSQSCLCISKQTRKVKSPSDQIQNEANICSCKNKNHGGKHQTAHFFGEKVYQKISIDHYYQGCHKPWYCLQSRKRNTWIF